MIWLTGGSLVAAVVMITGLIVLILVMGTATFWPTALVRITTVDGETLMGEVTREDEFSVGPELLATIRNDEARARAGALEGREVRRRLVRSERSSDHFEWVSDFEIALDDAGEPIEDEPEWAILFERVKGERIAAFPHRFLIRSEGPGEDGAPPTDLVSAEGEAAAWAEFQRHHERVRALVERAREIQEKEIGALNGRLRDARIALQERKLTYQDEVAGEKEVEARRALDAAETRARLAAIEIGGRFDLDPAAFRGYATPEEALGVLAAAVARFQLTPDAFPGAGDLDPDTIIEHVAAIASRPLEEMAAAHSRSAAAALASAQAEYLRTVFSIQVLLGEEQIEADRIDGEAARYRLVVKRADGSEEEVAVGDVVRALPANQLGFFAKVGAYLSRWGEFLGGDPRKSNSEGGVFPAIIGTVTMTLVMCVFVVPFGVLAALYMREYAKAGPVISAVRIAVNNLAGVPSIVFGIFGLGFFCYIVGVRVDDLFYRADPDPTFGKGGLLWAAATLALLTLPVVIVATEEALAAVPSSMREGSYACGASRWQTIRRIVLPRALPGIMTGSILSMARGAGEVAPLMLVGAVKFTDKSPVDMLAPFVHLDRSFMHLGFHIYDVGFQSQNSEAGKPMVFTTTLLLITIVALLNIIAVWLRSRLRKRFVTGEF